MKKKLIYSALVAIIVASGYMGYSTHASSTSVSVVLQLASVEALANCELLDGTLPNGYCRKNDYNHYFCGSSHWWYSDNCLQ